MVDMLASGDKQTRLDPEEVPTYGNSRVAGWVDSGSLFRRSPDIG